MMKKVLIAVASIGGGGAERVAVQLANYFSQNNVNVQICYWNKSNNEYSLQNEIVANHITSRSRIIGLAKVINRFKPDVLLSFTDVSNVIAYLAKILVRSDLVYIPTIHNDLKIRDSHLQLNIKAKILRWLHIQACNKSNHVVVVSEGAKKSFIDYYNIADEKCTCIYNPVLDNVNVKANKTKQINTKLKIVMAGRLTHQKNYFLLVNVAEQLKNHGFNFSIDIFGDGELKNKISNQIACKQLNDHVHLRGFTPNLSKKLENYDLFLMTSSWEGFGNVLVEALDRGLDVISTDCPSGPKEVLGNGMFGTLTPVDNVDAIVDEIIAGSYPRCVSIRELHEHLNLFTLKSVGDNYLDLFKKLDG